MSNHFNNILDGEELIQNSSLQLLFSPRWAKIEKAFYIIFTIFLILYILSPSFTYFTNYVYRNEAEIIHLSLCIPFLVSIPYIWQFRKFRSRYNNPLSVNDNRRLAFLIITPVMLLITILLLLLSITFVLLTFLFVLDKDNYPYDFFIAYPLLITIPLTIISCFLSSYYAYSIHFVYCINNTPIDNLLN